MNGWTGAELKRRESNWGVQEGRDKALASQ